jgi:thioredoxin reductase (NADPH)
MWDVIIIGGGPAAIQAAIMGASEGMKVIVIEKDKVGGQIGQTPLLENFIASNGGITGPQFAEAMKAQAQAMGAVIRKGTVLAFDQQTGGHFNVYFDDPVGQGTAWEDTHSIVIATGNRWQDLDIPGIRQGIQDRTVHYGPVECLSVDPAGQDVAVYGGGPSAGQAIIALAGKARTVHVLMRSTLRMPQYLVDKITNLSNVRLYEHTTIKHVESMNGYVEIRTLNGQEALPEDIRADHLFMCSGLVPNTEWLPPEIAKDENGRILVGATVDASSFLGTSVDGVYAIGDARHGSTARVSAAIGDGAHVVTELWKFFRKNPSCSVCSGEHFARAAGEYNPFKKGQVVHVDGYLGAQEVVEVLNAQQVRIAGINSPVDVARVRLNSVVA